jgi:hypothetical protein
MEDSMTRTALPLVLLLSYASVVMGCGSSEGSAADTGPDASLTGADAAAGPGPGPSPAGDSGTTDAGQTPDEAPAIVSFTAAKSTVTTGSPASLTAVFTGGTATIDQGVGPVASGAVVPTASLAADTTFTLTVTGADGSTVTRTLTVAVVAAPAITSFTAAKPTITTGTATTLNAVFSGGTATVDQGIGAVTTGADKATGNLTADTTFTLTVTNAAGDSVTEAASVAVVAAPVITSFTADSTKVSRNTATNLNPVFTGGTGSIDQGIGAVTSGASVPSGNVVTQKTFTLTVTNAANDSVTANVVVAAKRELFVASYENKSIAVFDEDADGDVAPKRRIVGPSTKLNVNVGIHVVGEEIIVASLDHVLTFDINADGDVAPKREITGASTGNAYAYGAFVANGELFVSNYNGANVSVFNLGDSGNVAPKRKITGASTQLTDPVTSWVDGNELFSTNFSGGKLVVHDVAAENDTAAKRSVSITNPIGITVVGNEAIVAGVNGVTVFDKTTLVQLRKITGSNTTIGYLWGCTVVGTELACTNYYMGTPNRILFFPVTGDGNLAPTRFIAGANTLLNGPTGIVLY